MSGSVEWRCTLCKVGGYGAEGALEVHMDSVSHAQASIRYAQEEIQRHEASIERHREDIEASWRWIARRVRP